MNKPLHQHCLHSKLIKSFKFRIPYSWLLSVSSHATICKLPSSHVFYFFKSDPLPRQSLENNSWILNQSISLTKMLYCFNILDDYAEIKSSSLSQPQNACVLQITIFTHIPALVMKCKSSSQRGLNRLPCQFSARSQPLYCSKAKKSVQALYIQHYTALLGPYSRILQCPPDSVSSTLR